MSQESSRKYICICFSFFVLPLISLYFGCLLSQSCLPHRIAVFYSLFTFTMDSTKNEPDINFSCNVCAKRATTWIFYSVRFLFSSMLTLATNLVWPNNKTCPLAHTHARSYAHNYRSTEYCSATFFIET